MSWKVLAEAVGQFVNGPRLAFGGLLATGFLAYLFRQHTWMFAFPILFGALLVFDLVMAVRKPLMGYRQDAKVERLRREREHEKQKTAFDDLTMEALAQLIVVRIRGVQRFQVGARSMVDAALARSPLVRHIGPRSFWGDAAEYEVEDWAWKELADYVDGMAENSPDNFARFEQWAGRPWRSE